MSIEFTRQKAWLRYSVAALALTHVGCLELQKSEPKPDRTCTACHGDETRSGAPGWRAAPPRDLDGNTSTKAPGVGAHQVHLSKTSHAPVACVACHVVPETIYEPGHVDTALPAEVTFGELAVLADRQPTYERKTGNCTDTYCHRDATVDWTAARREPDTCGTCHGLPPAAPHPQNTQCATCHGEVVGPDGQWIAPERHVNGIVDVNVQGNCAACHGSNPEAGGPPKDLSGHTNASARGVGAHANHLDDSATHRAIACGECHLVPTSVDSKGHVDGDGRAEISFGVLAKTNRSRPSYVSDTAKCNNTYCHGTTTADWQAPRDSVAACGSCHGLPPPLPHVQQARCSDCHGRVVNSDRTMKEPSLHVNGTVEVDFGSDCESCHGSDQTGAPPPDLQGNIQPSARGVGAHAAHVSAGATHAAIACSTCHVVPSAVTAPGHIDADGVAEITFSGLATALGYKASYAANSAGCSSTYCHRDAQPVWQSPRSSDAACGSCHALPPPLPHPAQTNCSICHAGIDASRAFVAPELHVNGKVDLVPTLPCNACHGTAADGAPAPDTTGNQTPNARGVGAHAWHVQASLTHGVVACNECHRVPAEVNSVGHRDTALPAEIIFGSLAQAKGSAPQYFAANLTCSGSYCHGTATPIWTAPRSELEACGSCHGLPPTAPHPQRSDCSSCHGVVIDAARKFILPERHVDGTVDLSPMQCNTCHGSATDGAPPADVLGNTDPGAPGVGAHQAHVQGSATHQAIACNECHVVPSAWNSLGHLDSALPAEVSFGALARANGARPAYVSANHSCAGSYCHGGFTPTWTAPLSSVEACGSCHALPPPLPHPSTKDCSLCHGAVIDANQVIIHPELHVDGNVQVEQNCTACHGSAQNAAPPKDLSGNTGVGQLGVGAHQVHLSGGNFSRPLACGECHVVPATTTSPGHLDLAGSTPADVAFSGAAAAEGRNPVWARAAATCSGSWCHGPVDPLNQSPSWVGVSSGLTCTSCHGMPPAAPHPANAQCSNCHGDVDAQGLIIDRSLHVNGEVDFR